MTGKQIQAARATLPSGYAQRTEEERKLERELFCREMINSILIYDGVKALDEEMDRYLLRYVKELSKERVLELIKEQVADFEKAIVKRNVYTDWEGCTYNTCLWADEQ